MALSTRFGARAALVTTAIALLLGGGIAAPVAQAATPADVPLITSGTTNWKYLDNNTDPAGTNQDTLVWAKTGFDDSAWNTGTGSFGHKNGTTSGMGGGHAINTLLTRYIPGQTLNVQTYFFRSTFTITQEQIDHLNQLQGTVTYDHGLRIFVNGQKVAGYEDGNITQNLQYGGSNGADPDTSTFSVAPSVLQPGTNTIAVALYQCDSGSSDIFFNLSSLVAKFLPDAATITDLALNIGSSEKERNLVWYTDIDVPQVAQVAKKPAGAPAEFPTAGVQTFTATRGATTDGQFSQRTTITGLEASTEYLYRVGSDSQGWSGTYSFTTGALTGDYNFIFVGDPQIGASGNVGNDRTGWINTLNTAEQRFPGSEFIFSAGDQVENAPNESQYEAFLAPEQLRRLPLAPINGNHDVGSKAYEQHFNTPNWDPSYGAASSSSSSGGNYWFKYNDTLYVILNSNSRDHASHKAYMEKIVQEQGGDVKWKVLGFHHSIYSVASHTDDSDIIDRRANMPETISDLGFDLVLMGHDHSYTRSWLMNDGVPVEVGGTAQEQVSAKPGDVLYVTANSASGSKYYAVKAPNAPFAAVINQENKRNYSNVEVTDASITVTTYRSEDNTVVDKVVLKRADVTAPVLNVPAAAEVAYGSSFDALAGVTATDAVDGNLTSAITVTGSVNTAQLGEYTLTYTVSDAAGNEATQTRTVTVVRAPLTSAKPVIAGQARVGESLTAQPGTWSQGAALTYAWTADNAAIPGPASATLPVTKDLIGKSVAVAITGTLAGHTTVTQTSDPIVVSAGVLVPGKVTVEGSSKVGATLTAKATGWPAAAALRYTWTANGAAIAGGTGATLKLTPALAGKAVRVSVTGVLDGYLDAVVSTAPTSVAKAALKSATPKIAGIVKVGKTLKVKTGKWSAGTKLTYRWYANGKAIKGATKASLKLGKSVRAKKITVKVTGSQPGYATKTVTSKATKKVGKKPVKK
ncbi:hypothetical protein GCM10010401_12030 [Rarobacter faecitabidus]|uniref:3',5'-cyclic AMP phosphodiesterase CpdA n=1 Tax=Rarobacter faecitabidus TaxID=13243 RepID=A0A542ZP96_RARFA|nr:immunoglobulin-like domain-containing protein [Rarobacter faecitabidus]TQL62059.1 3',5'-cyclic AMP phosphodiesterase CpdA [Rarobacter faecitabidus]